MPSNRTKQWILLCGVLICTATPLCQAQDAGMPSEAKKTQTVVAPALLPKVVSSPLQVPEPAVPVKKASEKSWFRRIMEGTAIGAAIYNTDRQSDGRPRPTSNSR